MIFSPVKTGEKIGGYMNLYKENLALLKNGYTHAEMAIEEVTGNKISMLEFIYDKNNNLGYNNNNLGYNYVSEVFSQCLFSDGITTLDIIENTFDSYFDRMVFSIISQYSSIIECLDKLILHIVTQVKNEAISIIRNVAIFDFSLKNNKEFSFKDEYWSQFLSSYPVVMKSLDLHIEHWDVLLIDIFEKIKKIILKYHYGLKAVMICV